MKALRHSLLLLCLPGLLVCLSPGPSRAEEIKRVKYAISLKDPHPSKLPAKVQKTRWWKRSKKVAHQTLLHFDEKAQAWLREQGYTVLPADSQEEAPALVGLATLSPRSRKPSDTAEDRESPLAGRMSLRWLSSTGAIIATSRREVQGDGGGILKQLLEALKKDMSPALTAPPPMRWIKVELRGVGFAGYPPLKKAILALPEVSEVAMREAGPEAARWEVYSNLTAPELGKKLDGLEAGDFEASVSLQGEELLELTAIRN